jgi:hypothetical protein
MAIDTEGPAPAPSVLPAPFAAENNMAKIGPKEAALRAVRSDEANAESNRADRKAASAPEKAAGTPKPSRSLRTSKAAKAARTVRRMAARP